MRKKTLIPLFLFAFILFSCKKEKTTWDTDWSAPLAYGHLTIEDMIPVKYISTNTDGYLSLVVHEPILEFSLDTLIKLPDTVIVKKTAIGVASLNVIPGFELPDNFDQGYELGEIKLKRVILEKGEASTTISSPWGGKTKVVFSLPKVSSSDGIFERTYYLDAGSESSPSQISDIIDMAFHDMDLTGVDGIEYNTLEIGVLITSNQEEDFTVTNTDSISFSFSFKGLVPRYAKGYFGQYTFTDTTGISLLPMKKIVAGSINIDSIDLKLTVKNGFNLLAQSKISKVTGINSRTSNEVELDFIGKNTTLNIDPASGGLYDYVPSEYPLEINNLNSNIIDFIENLSDSIAIGYQLEINPFGNITAGSDEFFPDSKMELFLDAEFPLNFSANDLTIVDTIEIKEFNTGNISPLDAEVIIEYTNGFPMDADAKFYLLDENNIIIDSILSKSIVNAGSYTSSTLETTPHEGIVMFVLNQHVFDNMDLTKKIVLHIKFNTDGTENIKISPDTFFDFKLRSNLNIRISI